MDHKAKKLAGIVGLVLMALSASEAINMDIYADQIAPVVYLNGTVMFVAGLALVREHNVWSRDWRTLLTLCGWAALFLGLYRMFLPRAPQAEAGNSTYGLLALLFIVGAVLLAASVVKPTSRKP